MDSNPRLARMNFDAEYPGRKNPVGTIVGVRRNPAYDREFLEPKNRSDGAGRVLSYSDSHGLCFEVEHVDTPGYPPAGSPPRRAWYNADEIVYLMDPSSFFSASAAVNIGELRSITFDPPSFPVDLDEAIRNL